jgi:hypothetical protein
MTRRYGVVLIHRLSPRGVGQARARAYTHTHTHTHTNTHTHTHTHAHAHRPRPAAVGGVGGADAWRRVRRAYRTKFYSLVMITTVHEDATIEDARRVTEFACGHRNGK